MGHLDEATFAAKLGPCPGCGGTKHELHSMIDQLVPVMLADPAGTPRWAHDGEKFVDGTYRITCAGCKQVIFASDDCPRCHAVGALPSALKKPGTLAVPKRCTGCNGMELGVLALVPTLTVHAGGPAKPKALAELGEDGFCVAVIECEDCGVIAEAAGCPICGAAGPLRERP
jgi:hypothetical protein